MPPFPLQLHDLAAGQQWDKAARLCRFARDPSLWACLAVMAIGARELHTAEVAYAALDEIDKVQWVNYVKAIPTEEGRSAEVALFCRRRGDAENILLQAGLVYRAIKMNTRSAVITWNLHASSPASFESLVSADNSTMPLAALPLPRADSDS